MHQSKHGYRHTMLYFLDNSLSIDLKKFLYLNEVVHSQQNRQVFHVPSVNTSTYGIKCMKFHCPELWNNIWKNTININTNRKNNVSFDQIHNVHQFK